MPANRSLKRPILLAILIIAAGGTVWFINQTPEPVGGTQQGQPVSAASIPALPPQAGPPGGLLSRKELSGGVATPTPSLVAVRPEWRQVSFRKQFTDEPLKPAVDGVAAEAWIQPGQAVQGLFLEPNQNGEFPRVTLQPGEIVRIAVTYQDLHVDMPVAITVADGGRADGSRFGQSGKLSTGGVLAFDFESTRQAGMHRIFLTTASGDRKMLYFWVGSDAGP